MQKNNLPKDVLLIQEILAKIPEGPEAFTKWAKDNYSRINEEFFKRVRKFRKFAEKNNQEGIYKTFNLVEKSLVKLFDFDEYDEEEDIAITKENFQAYFDKASSFLKLGKPANALHILKSLSVFASQNPRSPHKSLIEGNLGTVFIQLNQKDKALYHYKKALTNLEENISKEKILSNMATIYRDKKELSLAFEYGIEALKIAEKRKDRYMQFSHLTNLSLTKLEQNEIESSIKLLEDAYNISVEINEKDLMCDSLTRLSVLYGTKGNYDKCKELSIKARELVKSKEKKE